MHLARHSLQLEVVRDVRRCGAAFGAASLALALVIACTTEPELADPPTYRDGVGDLLRKRCAGCHAGSAPPAGWRADGFVAAVGCTNEGKAAVGAEPAIAAALDRPDHAGLLSVDERDALRRWALAGGPSARPGVHPRAFTDPRSQGSHGRFLHAKSYRPMLAADDDDACGRCHDGAPSKPAATTFAAPGATACTTCHADPDGPIACSTCHASNGARDACFHPEANAASHAAHLAASASRAEGLACATCHPQPAPRTFGPTHANGWVEVWFDHALAGREARFDGATKRCAGSCHSHGGARPEPAWGDARMGCSDCHGAPPANHYGGPCTSCHREADAIGASLAQPRMHVNGKVDLGDGSGKCGACHGRGDSPWPSSGAHPAHARPTGSKAVPCETCHDVPAPGDHHPFGKGGATVRLAGLSTHGGSRASYDPTTRTCAETYCHAGRGATAPSPRWGDGPGASACGACHSTPPPPPHPAGTTCTESTCHAGGAAVHVDGVVDRP